MLVICVPSCHYIAPHSAIEEYIPDSDETEALLDFEQVLCLYQHSGDPHTEGKVWSRIFWFILIICLIPDDSLVIYLFFRMLLKCLHGTGLKCISWTYHDPPSNSTCSWSPKSRIHGKGRGWKGWGDLIKGREAKKFSGRLVAFLAWSIPRDGLRRNWPAPKAPISSVFFRELYRRRAGEWLIFLGPQEWFQSDLPPTSKRNYTHRNIFVFPHSPHASLLTWESWPAKLISLK